MTAPAPVPAVAAVAALAGLAWPGPLSHEFVRNAVLAGTPAALAVGLAGWFVVLRDQVFAGDALSHVAFTAGMAALAYGLDLRVGVYAGTLVVGALLGLVGGRAAHAGEAAVGVVFAWVLGLGAYFLSVFLDRQATGQSSAAVRVLFGSVFGIGAGQVRLTALVSAAVVVAVLAVGRPLLLSTLQPDAAAARGIPVRLVEVGFSAALGLAVAQAVQVVGALLVLALVATPAATAGRCTARPWRALALSGGMAVGAVWVGIGLSYLRADLPPSFVIVSLLFVAYLASITAGAVRSRRRRGAPGGPVPAAVSGSGGSGRRSPPGGR
ncbi:MAG: metal ABC transporter permease [Acidimicrobiales bacterium]